MLEENVLRISKIGWNNIVKLWFMAPIEQFFVTLNAATPMLFVRFDKRGDRQKVVVMQYLWRKT